MTAVWVLTAPVLDELVEADGAVVLLGDDDTGHRVLRITVLGQQIREVAADGIWLPALVQALIERLGPPGDDDGNAVALVEAAAESLADEGIVTLRRGSPAAAEEGVR